MTINIASITDAIVSHAAALGHFERVNLFEPKRNDAGSGMTAAVWLQRLGPTRSSGLGSTTIRLEFVVRIYTPMFAEPQDMIDPAVLAAVDALMGAYSGDFTLGGVVRNVDLLGQHGTALSAIAGYLERGGALFRVMDVTLPLIINDTWDQEA